jgi:uncharacterized RDD family membrane protein YckC
MHLRRCVSKHYPDFKLLIGKTKNQYFASMQVEANKGARVGNVITDTICVFIIYSIIEIVYSILYTALYEDYPFIPGFLFYLIYSAYYFLFEQFVGATPGKMLTGTVVRNYDGSKPSVKRIFLRSVLRIFPHDQLSFLCGATGLHDELSKTKVVYKRPGM